jgi:zinc transporter
MSGFAYHVDTAGKATKCDIKDALSVGEGLVWVHLSTNNEHAQAWLNDVAKLDDYLVDALTASETRTRWRRCGSGRWRGESFRLRGAS